MWVVVVLLTAGGLAVAGLVTWVLLLRREREELKAVVTYLGHKPPRSKRSLRRLRKGREQIHLATLHGRRVAREHRTELMASAGAVTTAVVGAILLWPNGEELPGSQGPHPRVEPSPPASQPSAGVTPAPLPTLTQVPGPDGGRQSDPDDVGATASPVAGSDDPGQGSGPSDTSPPVVGGPGLSPTSVPTEGPAPEPTPEPRPPEEPPDDEPPPPDEPPEEPPSPDKPPPDEPQKDEPEKDSRLCVPPDVADLPEHVEICVTDPTGDVLEQLP